MKQFFVKLYLFFYLFLKNKYNNLRFRSITRSRAAGKVVNADEYLDALFNLNGGEYDIKFKAGFIIRCRKDDLPSISETCIMEDYRPNENFRIKEGDVVFDVGAHIGSFSVSAAKKGATVFAFEPERSNYGLLLKNIELNGLGGKIIPLNFGLGKKDETIRLNISAGNTGGHSTLANEGNKTDEIKLKTFATASSELGVGKIDLFKIDIEGGEYGLFESMSKDDFSKIKKIVGEYHLFSSKLNLNYGFIKKLLQLHYKKVAHFFPYYFYAHND